MLQYLMYTRIRTLRYEVYVESKGVLLSGFKEVYDRVWQRRYGARGEG